MALNSRFLRYTIVYSSEQQCTVVQYAGRIHTNHIQWHTLWQLCRRHLQCVLHTFHTTIQSFTANIHCKLLTFTVRCEHSKLYSEHLTMQFTVYTLRPGRHANMEGWHGPPLLGGHCTVHTEYCTLYTLHCVIYRVHCTVNSSKLYSVACSLRYVWKNALRTTMFNIRCKLYTQKTVQILCWPHCKLHIPWNVDIVYITHCKLYSL